MILIFKVKGQCHSANVFKSQYLQRVGRRELILACTRNTLPCETKCALDFKVKYQGHSANALKSTYLMNFWLLRSDFDIHTLMISHGEQNVTLTVKVKGRIEGIFESCITYQTTITNMPSILSTSLVLFRKWQIMSFIMSEIAGEGSGDE